VQKLQLDCAASLKDYHETVWWGTMTLVTSLRPFEGQAIILKGRLHCDMAHIPEERIPQLYIYIYIKK